MARFLTIEELLELHALAIHHGGGSVGVRDMGRLESVIASQSQLVFGREVYPTLALKAAAIMRNIIQDHPFVDGNKRTGLLVALTFLEVNGINFAAEQGELEDFAVSVVTEQLSVEEITTWLDSHVRD